jgi:ABC-type spermidine/putrescine transport system permease subunit I
LHNYAELFHPSYLRFLADMLWMSLVATCVGVALAVPIAHWIARTIWRRMRVLAIGFLVGFMFLNALVRVYSLQLALGPVGIGPWLGAFLGISPSSRDYAAIAVVLGLLHHNVPLSTLLLVGTIQNVNPRLAEAAQSLGASRAFAHLTTTLPLSAPGIVGALLINYTIAISAFVVPLILGQGKVVFMSNLIYSRFGEASNYPSGSAMAIQLLLLSLAVVYGLTRLFDTISERPR